MPSMTDWKSTAAGVLSFLITTLTIVSTFLAAGNINDGGASVSSIHVSTWVVVAVNLALALCRAWVGWITTNADAGAVAKAIAPLSPLAPAAPIPLTPPTAASLAATPPKP